MLYLKNIYVTAIFMAHYSKTRTVLHVLFLSFKYVTSYRIINNYCSDGDYSSPYTDAGTPGGNPVFRMVYYPGL